MSSEVKRAVRVAGRMREELASALGGLSDPRVLGVIVSRVELTDDLQLARIYVRRESGAASPQEQAALLRGLESAAGRLRQQVTRGLGLRYAPNLRFFYDEAQDAVSRVEELLAEIRRGT
jgi:ribosome-binding factor A